ncbi:Phosphotransferase enzyme family [Aspergillus sclerotialis]|uniref:Phosphotransferase enzyme family n=1 Tax=Aspergillus sclerotialis TaxID=2070753 RepID=A0A3A2ZW91_9EURO|nr:Phosphotransferase enzyme family [Aspergillus sclerotialis]
MIHPPQWLTNEAIDLISLDKYESVHAEFMKAFAEEEKALNPPFHLYPVMKQGLEKGTFWCSLALMSPTALFKIFYDYIQPRFSKVYDDPAFWRITMPYWTFDTFAFIEHKVNEKERYDFSLREAFKA